MAIVVRTSEQIRNARMTPEQQARLDAMRDEEIDCSDIPEPTDEDIWYRPGIKRADGKQQVTLLLDPDVLAFVQKRSNAKASRVNAMLRKLMPAQRKAKKGVAA